MRTVFEVMRIGRGGMAKITHITPVNAVSLSQAQNRRTSKFYFMGLEAFFLVYRTSCSKFFFIIFGQQDKNS